MGLYECIEDTVVTLENGELVSIRAGRWCTDSHPVKVKWIEAHPERFVRVEDAPTEAKPHLNGGY